jgi:hypothetical protein
VLVPEFISNSSRFETLDRVNWRLYDYPQLC